MDYMTPKQIDKIFYKEYWHLINEPLLVKSEAQINAELVQAMKDQILALTKQIKEQTEQLAQRDAKIKQYKAVANEAFGIAKRAQQYFAKKEAAEAALNPPTPSVFDAIAAMGKTPHAPWHSVVDNSNRS